jgi:uncharacterized protein involved in outer membrane biogenesis
MTARRTFKWVFISLSALCAICLIGILVISTTGINISLNPLRGRISSMASAAFHRNVIIEGDVNLKLSLQPALEINGFRMTNPRGWKPSDFARIDLVKGVVDVLPLLKGKIRIAKVRAEGGRLNLATLPDGTYNWKFGEKAREPETVDRPPDSSLDTATDSAKALVVEFVELRQLSLTDLAVTYRDGGLNRDYSFRLDAVKGSAAAGDPMMFDIIGAFQNDRFQLKLDGEPLQQLLDPSRAWSVNLNGTIGDSPVMILLAMAPLGLNAQNRINISAEMVALGELLQQLAIADDMEIAADRFAMDLILRGHNLRDLFEQSDFKIEMDNGLWEWGKPDSAHRIQVKVTDGRIQSSAGKPVTVSVKGAYQDKPFHLSLQGDPLSALTQVEKPWQMSLEANALGINLRGEGVWEPHKKIPEARLSLVSPKTDAAELFSWLGLHDDQQVTAERIELVTVARGHDPAEIIDLSEIRIEFDDALWLIRNPNMASDLQFKIEKFQIARPPQKPIQFFLKANLAKDPPMQGAKPVPLSIEGTARQELLAGPSNVKDSPQRYRLDLRGRIANSDIVVSGTLARWQSSITATLDVSFQRIDFGRFLYWMEIAEGLDAAAGELKLAANLKGRTLDEMIWFSDFHASLTDGYWIMKDKNTDAKAKINIQRGTFSALNGKPIALELDAELKKVPVFIEIKTHPLNTFSQTIEWLPVELHVDTASTQIDLKASSQLPVGQKDLKFQMTVAGKSLNSLDHLFEVSLPPLGPYAVSGHLVVNSEGYSLSHLLVKVRNSDLTGRARLETTGKRPLLDIDLTTNTLHIDDFVVEGWSPLKSSANKEADHQMLQAVVEDRDDQKLTNALLSPDIMRSMEARVAVAVNEVLSGDDSLGSGSVIASLKDGRFEINPLKLKIPGGDINMSMNYEVSKRDMLAGFVFDIDRFDYGILARRIKANTRMKGRISLDAKLTSRAEDFDLMMRNVDGYIDVGIWPEDLEAGILDLWAVNLLTAVVSEVDKGQASRLNCVIGQFSIHDGFLQQEQLVIDTSRMRVKGEVKANFKTEEVYLYVKPSGKRPEFFSLATPIEVKGKFSDFRAGVAPGGLAGTAIRFISSPLHVPVRRLFSEDLPPEGYDACKELQPRR